MVAFGRLHVRRWWLRRRLLRRVRRPRGHRRLWRLCWRGVLIRELMRQHSSLLAGVGDHRCGILVYAHARLCVFAPGHAHSLFNFFRTHQTCVIACATVVFFTASFPLQPVREAQAF